MTIILPSYDPIKRKEIRDRRDNLKENPAVYQLPDQCWNVCTYKDKLLCPLYNGSGMEVRFLFDLNQVHKTLIPPSLTSHITACCSNDDLFVFVSPDTLYCYDESYHLLKEIHTEGEYFRAVHIDHDGNNVYWGGDFGTLNKYDVQTDTHTTHKQHNDDIRGIDTDGSTLVTVSNDNKVVRWDRTNMTNVQQIVHSHTVEVVTVTSQNIIFGADSKTVTITERDDLTSVVNVLTNPVDDVTSVVMGAEHFICSDDGGNIFIFDTDFSLKETLTVPGQAEITALKNGIIYYTDNQQNLYEYLIPTSG